MDVDDSKWKNIKKKDLRRNTLQDEVGYNYDDQKIYTYEDEIYKQSRRCFERELNKKPSYEFNDTNSYSCFCEKNLVASFGDTANSSFNNNNEISSKEINNQTKNDIGKHDLIKNFGHFGLCYNKSADSRKDSERICSENDIRNGNQSGDDFFDFSDIALLFLKSKSTLGELSEHEDVEYDDFVIYPLHEDDSNSEYYVTQCMSSLFQDVQTNNISQKEHEHVLSNVHSHDKIEESPCEDPADTYIFRSYPSDFVMELENYWKGKEIETTDGKSDKYHNGSEKRKKNKVQKKHCVNDEATMLDEIFVICKMGYKTEENGYYRNHFAEGNHGAIRKLLMGSDPFVCQNIHWISDEFFYTIVIIESESKQIDFTYTRKRNDLERCKKNNRCSIILNDEKSCEHFSKENSVENKNQISNKIISKEILTQISKYPLVLEEISIFLDESKSVDSFLDIIRSAKEQVSVNNDRIKNLLAELKLKVNKWKKKKKRSHVRGYTNIEECYIKNILFVINGKLLVVKQKRESEKKWEEVTRSLKEKFAQKASQQAKEKYEQKSMEKEDKLLGYESNFTFLSENVDRFLRRSTEQKNRTDSKRVNESHLIGDDGEEEDEHMGILSPEQSSYSYLDHLFFKLEESEQERYNKNTHGRGNDNEKQGTEEIYIIRENSENENEAVKKKKKKKNRTNEKNKKCNKETGEQIQKSKDQKYPKTNPYKKLENIAISRVIDIVIDSEKDRNEENFAKSKGVYAQNKDDTKSGLSNNTNTWTPEEMESSLITRNEIEHRNSQIALSYQNPRKENKEKKRKRKKKNSKALAYNHDFKIDIHEKNEKCRRKQNDNMKSKNGYATRSNSIFIENGGNYRSNYLTSTNNKVNSIFSETKCSYNKNIYYGANFTNHNRKESNNMQVSNEIEKYHQNDDSILKILYFKLWKELQKKHDQKKQKTRNKDKEQNTMEGKNDNNGSISNRNKNNITCKCINANKNYSRGKKKRTKSGLDDISNSNYNIISCDDKYFTCNCTYEYHNSCFNNNNDVAISTVESDVEMASGDDINDVEMESPHDNGIHNTKRNKQINKAKNNNQPLKSENYKNIRKGCDKIRNDCNNSKYKYRCSNYFDHNSYTSTKTNVSINKINDDETSNNMVEIKIPGRFLQQLDMKEIYTKRKLCNDIFKKERDHGSACQTVSTRYLFPKITVSIANSRDMDGIYSISFRDNKSHNNNDASIDNYCVGNVNLIENNNDDIMVTSTSERNHTNDAYNRKTDVNSGEQQDSFSCNNIIDDNKRSFINEFTESVNKGYSIEHNRKNANKYSSNRTNFGDSCSNYCTYSNNIKKKKNVNINQKANCNISNNRCVGKLARTNCYSSDREIEDVKLDGIKCVQNQSLIFSELQKNRNNDNNNLKVSKSTSRSVIDYCNDQEMEDVALEVESTESVLNNRSSINIPLNIILGGDSYDHISNNSSNKRKFKQIQKNYNENKNFENKDEKIIEITNHIMNNGCSNENIHDRNNEAKYHTFSINHNDNYKAGKFDFEIRNNDNSRKNFCGTLDLLKETKSEIRQTSSHQVPDFRINSLNDIRLNSMSSLESEFSDKSLFEPFYYSENTNNIRNNDIKMSNVDNREDITNNCNATKNINNDGENNINTNARNNNHHDNDNESKKNVDDGKKNKYYNKQKSVYNDKTRKKSETLQYFVSKADIVRCSSRSLIFRNDSKKYDVNNKNIQITGEDKSENASDKNDNSLDRIVDPRNNARSYEGNDYVLECFGQSEINFKNHLLSKISMKNLFENDDGKIHATTGYIDSTSDNDCCDKITLIYITGWYSPHIHFKVKTELHNSNNNTNNINGCVNSEGECRWSISPGEPMSRIVRPSSSYYRTKRKQIDEKIKNLRSGKRRNTKENEKMEKKLMKNYIHSSGSGNNCHPHTHTRTHTDNGQSDDRHHDILENCNEEIYENNKCPCELYLKKIEKISDEIISILPRDIVVSEENFLDRGYVYYYEVFQRSCEFLVNSGGINITYYNNNNQDGNIINHDYSKEVKWDRFNGNQNYFIEKPGTYILFNGTIRSLFPMPSKPPILRKIDVGNSSVHFCWSMPLIHSEFIDSFSIYRDGVEIGNVSKDITEIKDVNVLGLQTHIYNVRAVTCDKVFGHISDNLIVRTGNPGRPSAPQDLCCDGHSCKHIELKWRHPADNGGTPILHYYIFKDNKFYQKVPSENLKPFQSWIDFDVVPKRSYIYFVIASNLCCYAINNDHNDYQDCISTKIDNSINIGFTNGKKNNEINNCNQNVSKLQESKHTIGVTESSTNNVFDGNKENIHNLSLGTPSEVVEVDAVDASCFPRLSDSKTHILLQGFNWRSCSNRHGWYNVLSWKMQEIASFHTTLIWLPPPTECFGLEGYMPTRWYNLSTRYGTIHRLKALLKEFCRNDIAPLVDVVINHRCATKQDKNGEWMYFENPDWGPWAVVRNNLQGYKGEGNVDTGVSVTCAPDIDHTNIQVQKDVKKWTKWLIYNIGYKGIRFDMGSGYGAQFQKEYVENVGRCFAVGEYWDGNTENLVNYVRVGQGTLSTFDFAFYYHLRRGLETGNLGILNCHGRLNGVVGIEPQWSVTFIENHDTDHLSYVGKFCGGDLDAILQGYALLLTHPGIPQLFWDHIFDYGIYARNKIREMCDIRHRYSIHSTSGVYIARAEYGLYAAFISPCHRFCDPGNSSVAMKIGWFDWQPDGSGWNVACSGTNFCIWLR